MRRKKKPIRSQGNIRIGKKSNVLRRTRRTLINAPSPRITTFKPRSATKIKVISRTTSTRNTLNRRRKLYSSLYSKPLKKDKKCMDRIKNADSARRHAFFKAKHKGGSSSRPEHNRLHKRSC